MVNIIGRTKKLGKKQAETCNQQRTFEKNLNTSYHHDKSIKNIIVASE